MTDWNPTVPTPGTATIDTDSSTTIRISGWNPGTPLVIDAMLIRFSPKK